MNLITALLEFEEKYSFLYDELVGGVAVYTCLRDDVAGRLVGQKLNDTKLIPEEKGKIFVKRFYHTFSKWRKYKSCKTVIFTSSVYRRDKGRNLTAELLIERYKDAVVFEWPSRDENFDRAYFDDKLPYVPLDGYLILYKLYRLLHKREISKAIRENRVRLKEKFALQPPETNGEKCAVDYLLDTLPESLVTTMISQKIFKWMFRNYKNIQYAVDFWGSGRENIIPVLFGKPKSIEQQHGLITKAHPGYIYPSFVRKSRSSLFNREILVYGEKTKHILCEDSIYNPSQIMVVGNPRIQMYKKIFSSETRQKKWVLFSSQTFEQDGTGSHYYDTVIPVLETLNSRLSKQGRYALGIKLHPRESQSVAERYRKKLPNAVVFDKTSDLYEVLNESYFHLTSTSTVLFEAAEFGVPTAVIQYSQYDPVSTFGFDVLTVNGDEGMDKLCEILFDEKKYNFYLDSIIQKARNGL